MRGFGALRAVAAAPDDSHAVLQRDPLLVDEAEFRVEKRRRSVMWFARDFGGLVRPLDDVVFDRP